MEELDFLFVYEHKVRELENLCLVKNELDRRGYKTRISYIENKENLLAVKPLYHAKVLLTMACYDNHTLYWQSKDFVKYDKVIDMQWENIVYPKDEERKDAYKNYTGIGKEVVHVSWGPQNEKRLRNAAGLSPDKIKVVGHIGMDFLRKPLSAYYLSREEMFARYGLDPEKETIFFASPYYGDRLSEEYIETMCQHFGQDWRDYYKFMCDSEKVVLSWFEETCRKNPDIQVVYRPHPGQPSFEALEVEKRVPNLHVIADYSVKQWIAICDRVYTGNSSVVVEAFFAQKMCQLLFPYPITKGFALTLFDGADTITSFEQFEDSIEHPESKFPVRQEKIDEIYLVDFKEYSYIKFANMCEEVLKDDSYRFTKEMYKMVEPDYDKKTRIIRALQRNDFLYGLYLKMIVDPNNHSAFVENQRKIRAHVDEIQKSHAHELTSEEEISKIIDRIQYALKKGEQ